MSEIYDCIRNAPLQPEPITIEIGRQLPEGFCRQVQVVDGQPIRCEPPYGCIMARHLVHMGSQPVSTPLDPGC